jgi:hypothetical protein
MVGGKVGKLREPEARILALQIAATFPGHTASTTQIKETAPKFRDWSDEDLQPSKTRGNECMWQQIIGNAVGSHHKTTVSIFAKGYAAKTRNGIRVTEKGLTMLRGKGLYE